MVSQVVRNGFRPSTVSVGMFVCWLRLETAPLTFSQPLRVSAPSEAFESGESLHIVMDYAEGGDLATAIRECLDSEAMLPQSWVQELSLQVVSALDYMHSRGVIHCDLKPGSLVFFESWNLMLAIGRPVPELFRLLGFSGSFHLGVAQN